LACEPAGTEQVLLGEDRDLARTEDEAGHERRLDRFDVDVAEHLARALERPVAVCGHHDAVSEGDEIARLGRERARITRGSAPAAQRQILALGERRTVELRPAPRGAATDARSPRSLDSWVDGTNTRIDSISSPQNSRRTGRRASAGKTSSTPPRTANSPRRWTTSARS